MNMRRSLSGAKREGNRLTNRLTKYSKRNVDTIVVFLLVMTVSKDNLILEYFDNNKNNRFLNQRVLRSDRDYYFSQNNNNNSIKTYS